MYASTDAYYATHAQAYFENTAFRDLSATALRFLAHVKPHGRIIDVGCGSGRDLRFFRAHGFQAEGIDACEALCKLARTHSGENVQCVRIEDWQPDKRFDGVWACASLLHLPMDAIFAFFSRLRNILEPQGAAFFSFKSGIESGFNRQGRYFMAFSLNDLQDVLQRYQELVLLEMWESSDALERSEVSWLSFVFGLARECTHG